MKKLLSGILLATTMVAAAGAAEYNTVQTDKSNLGFTFRQMGVPVDGRFAKFAATLRFDPAKAEAAQVTLSIDLASIDTGSKEANEEAVGKQWFNVKAFPSAAFTSTKVRSLGANRYEVSGNLTLKGKTRETSTPVTFRTEGNTGIFEGSFTLKRADYGIGEGPWADFDTVGNDIIIKFRVLAAIGPAKK